MAKEEQKWEVEGEKEQYPYLHLFNKINEAVMEGLNIPKEVLCKCDLLGNYRSFCQISLKSNLTIANRYTKD